MRSDVTYFIDNSFHITLHLMLPVRAVVSLTSGLFYINASSSSTSLPLCTTQRCSKSTYLATFLDNTSESADSWLKIDNFYS